jgi:RHS repeat-associated protein
LSQLTQVDRKAATNPGHLITDYQYDAVGRLIDINNHFNTTNISHETYSYDDGNRLTTKSGTDGNSTVGYGKDNQISTVDNATRPDEAYSFNALGIRAGWVTDPLDKRRVLNDGKYQYQYDDEGNLTQKQELVTGKLTNYSWDYRNRLVKVASGTQTVEYLYDAEDKRVGKKVNGVTTEKYVYDGADIALVVDSAGTLVERYLFGDGVDNVLSREKGGALVWSLGDRQGSVVDLVDEDGNVLNHFVYDSFGNRTGDTTVEFRFGYTGRELDGETGLYFYRARYYDPANGRFISEDPLGFGAGDTNLYRYVGNSPTNATDPSGMILPLIALAIYGAIGGALVAGAYGVADHLEHDGSLGNIDWGDIAQKASIGAAVGSTLGVAGGIAFSGLAAAGVAESTLILGSQFIGATGTGWQAGTGIANIQNGKPYTGALDLISAGFGVKGLVSGHHGYLQAVTKENAAAQAKIARLDNLGSKLDDLQAQTQDLIKQADRALTDYHTPDPWLSTSHPSHDHVSNGQILPAAPSSISEFAGRLHIPSKAGNFSDLPANPSIREILSRLPASAIPENFIPLEGGSQIGVKFKWKGISPTTRKPTTFKLRLHDPDPKHPGSNSANGWIYRLQEGSRYYDPKTKTWNTKAVLDSKNTLNNDSHIPMQTPPQDIINLM